MRATALYLAFALASPLAYAESFFHPEVAIGAAAYVRGADGLWVQDGFEHRLELTAPAVEVGLTGDIAPWLAWHLDYAWLGAIRSQSLATPSDANYNLKTRQCNGTCWPLANYSGSGHDQGFYLTLEPHYDVGSWRFGVAAGPYLHRATWAEDVTSWHSSPDSASSNLHVTHDPKWQVGGVVGVSVEYKHFRLAYQYFANGRSPRDPVPQIWNGAHVVTLGYRW